MVRDNAANRGFRILENAVADDRTPVTRLSRATTVEHAVGRKVGIFIEDPSTPLDFDLARRRHRRRCEPARRRQETFDFGSQAGLYRS